MRRIPICLLVFVLLFICSTSVKSANPCTGLNVNDIIEITHHFADSPSDPNYLAKYDLNNDTRINEDDVLLARQCFGINQPGQPGVIPPAQLPESPTGNFTAGGLVGQLVSKILPIVLGLAGFLTVIIIVISGIQFITSSGNPEAAASARSRLIFALVGFVIIILAFAITQIIDRIFLGGSGVV